MNDTPTVEPTVSTTPSAPDLAPAPASSAASQADMAATIIRNRRSDSAQQGLLSPEGRKRPKTWGEFWFNVRTYAGIALLGNEAASLLIITQTEHGIGKQWFDRQMAWFKALEGKKFVPEYVHQGSLLKMLIAVVGGMLMVPFIKHYEDHKGEIVRESDRKHYGPRADTDPALIEAHKEMDEAPKQTWGSLWKGRALTVGAAMVVDSMVGGEDAPSTKLFKNNETYQKYASMERIAGQTSNKIMNVLKVAESNRPTWDKWLRKSSWLLVLSSTLTALFYVSSKLFATRRDHKLEQHEEALRNGTVLRDDGLSELGSDSPQTQSQPRTQVNAITRENTISALPQLAQSI